MSVRMMTSRVVRFFGIGLKRLFWRTQLAKPAPALKAIRRIPLRPQALSRGPPGVLGRMVWRSVRAGGQGHARAFSMALWRGRKMGASRVAVSGVTGALAWLKFHGSSDTIHRIKDIFGAIDKEPSEDENWPNALTAYDVGTMIAKGCNAAVHEARLQPQLDGLCAVPPFRSFDQTPHRNYGLTVFDSHRAPSYEERFQQAVERRRKYPYALKLMFNYHHTSREQRILREMSRELVPGVSRNVAKLIEHWEKPVESRHPNIIEIKTAFVDSIPILPGAATNYPEALPSDTFEDGLGRNKTLFILMKRYSMTLREYLLQYQPPMRTSQVLVGQMLEAIVFLQNNKISHRDLKSDNVLLEFDAPGDTPKLVLTDFGCCLASGSFKLPYPHPDMDLGGNVALRPPEIRSALPHPRTVLDFSKADLWAAGTLAYEIFTGTNPFYILLNSAQYRETDLKPLPKEVPPPVRKLTSHLLRRDPDKRPAPSCAANVVCLSLFRASNFKVLVEKVGLDLSGRSAGLWMKLSQVMALFATETILASRLLTLTGEIRNSNDLEPISKAELQLRTIFLKRLDESELTMAIPYFLADDRPRYDSIL